MAHIFEILGFQPLLKGYFQPNCTSFTNLVPKGARSDCWVEGWGLLEGQVFISDGNKPQNQSNHIIIYQKNLYFVLKDINGLNYKFTKDFFQTVIKICRRKDIHFRSKWIIYIAVKILKRNLEVMFFDIVPTAFPTMINRQVNFYYISQSSLVLYCFLESLICACSQNLILDSGASSKHRHLFTFWT